MSGRHVAISTWLQALDLLSYLSIFSAFGGVEDLLYVTERELRDLGLKNSAHRAKVISSLRVLREKYERGNSPGVSTLNTMPLRLNHSPTSLTPSSPPSPPSDPTPLLVSSDALQQELQRELNSDPAQLQSQPWYHGTISRQRAEALVTSSGDFLVRDSVSKPGELVLTCGWRGAALHFLLNAVLGAGPPGSLPSVTFQLQQQEEEEAAFSSVPELVHCHLATHKPLTAASGAILRHPVARLLPLSCYDAKYGSGGSGGYYSHCPSPLSSPVRTPIPSPGLTRRAGRWSGSQPALSVGETEGSEFSFLDRFGSMPAINAIPPGGPEHMRRRQQDLPPAPVKSFRQRADSEPTMVTEVDVQAPSPPPCEDLTPTGSENDLSVLPCDVLRTPSHSESRGLPLSLSQTVSVSAFPVENSPSPVPPCPKSVPTTPAGEIKSSYQSPFPPSPSLHTPRQPPLPSHSAPSTPLKADGNVAHLPPPSPSPSLSSTRSESSLNRPPPPKPCRVPSFRYKHRPQVQIRNQQLYEDDGRDYTDVEQLSGPPSWTQDLPTPLSGLSSSSPPHPMSKSQSFRDRRTKEMMVNGQVNTAHQGFRTLPHKSKLHKPSVRCVPSPRGVPGHGERACFEGSVHTVGSHKRVRNGPFRPPELSAESCIQVERFQSCLLPPDLHRRLDSGLLLHTKAILLSTQAAHLARHLTSADLRMWRVKGEDDLGLGVTSGIELCTLPQGEQLREDVIERSECQRLWVMTSVLTCTAVKERAEMVKVWVEVARELESGLGNLYSLASLMEALTSPQVQRLANTWRTLRQHHTPSAFTFDTRLRPLFQSLRLRGTPSPPFTRPLTLPYLTPTLRLLQESMEQEDRGSHVHRLMTSWHPSDLHSSLDVVLHHLHNARSMACQTELLSSSARQVLADIRNVLTPGGLRGRKGTGSGEENVQDNPDLVEEKQAEKRQEDVEELNMSYIYSKLQSFSDDCKGKDLTKTVTENQENLPETPQGEGLNAQNTPVRLQHVDKLSDCQENSAEKQNFSSIHKDVLNIQDKMEDFEDKAKNSSEFEDNSSKERRKEEEGQSDVEDMVRTEFQLKLMWGPQATLAGRPQRVNNLEHLLTVLSERLEPPPNSGTEL